MGPSATQLLVILAIVIVVFGTKRLRNLGTDLGGAIKGFRSAIKDGEESTKTTDDKEDAIEGEVTAKKTDKD